MDFLQSKIWRDFQASVGREVFEVEGINIIKHTLPVVGDYFYIPRVDLATSDKRPQVAEQSSLRGKQVTSDLINLAKKKKVGWIRVEPESESALNTIKNSLGSSASKYKIVKAPHDMQPRETLVIDISKSEEELLAEMKQKTRYNLNLAKKKEIKIFSVNKNCHPEFISGSNNEMLNQVQHDINYYINEFLRLVKITSERDGIKSHEEEYYRKMVEKIPAENLKIYLAEYEGPASTREDATSASTNRGKSTRGGKIIVANLVIFFQDTAIYLHGASDNEYRNVMAPYLLQWKQIQDAKEAGCKKYDFGGIKSEISNSKLQISNKSQNSKFKIQNSGNWAGITRFKLGFSPNTSPTQFLGCYDIVLKPLNYALYRTFQKIKALI